MGKEKKIIKILWHSSRNKRGGEHLQSVITGNRREEIACKRKGKNERFRYFYIYMALLIEFPRVNRQEFS